MTLRAPKSKGAALPSETLLSGKSASARLASSRARSLSPAMMAMKARMAAALPRTSRAIRVSSSEAICASALCNTGSTCWIDPAREGGQFAARHHQVGVRLDQTRRFVEVLGGERMVDSFNISSDGFTRGGVQAIQDGSDR